MSPPEVWIVVQQDCEDINIVAVFGREGEANQYAAEEPYVPFQKGRWVEQWEVQA